MKTLRILICMCTALTLSAGVVLAQDQAEMEAWMKAATPGAQHKDLAKMAGTWDCVLKQWMDPAGDPMESKATCERKSVMDGRYLIDEFKGNMMGMAFLGMGVTGYNNSTGEYETIWFDNMGTSISKMTGPMEGNKMVQTGDVTNPMGGTMSVEAVTEVIDNDKQVFTYYMDMGGQKVKAMEITYTRAGAKADKADEEDGGW